jgi:tRNA1Val (adenine37-N6)-methyltransferase
MSKKSDARPFHLKQFSLHHHQSSMKVGTDSLTLGIWTQIKNSGRILDVGTGSGILALLMAARSDDFVDAIELDEASYAEASNNFVNSPYADRLRAIHDNFNLYTSRCNQKYELIVSNPPFFINDMRSLDLTRNNARHGDSLNYSELCEGVGQILNLDGRFCLVLPYNESKFFIVTARKNKLHVNRQMIVFPKRGAQPNRICLELSFTKSMEIKSEKFIIREENNQFTEQYIHFFKDFLIGLD